MKWFRHQSDAYTDFALRQIIEDFDGEGYAVFWHCIELVAQQGKNYRLKAPTKWQKQLSLTLKISEEKIGKIIKSFGTLNLINEKALNKGDLYVPKMRRYSDEYTKRVRRESIQDVDSVPLQHVQHVQHNTIHNNTEKRPFYKNLPLRKRYGKWEALEEGVWKEFSGSDKEIIWK